MADFGVKVREPAPGVAEYNDMIQSGMGAEAANAERARQIADQQHSGMKGEDIARYWGEGIPNTKTLDTHVSANINAAHADDPKVADDPVEMFAAGWDMSVTGLAIAGKPKTIAPEHSGFAGDVAYGTAMLLGDAPAIVAGLVGGFVGGAAAGTAVGGPAGGVAGAALGAGSGSFALPTAMRETMMDQYEHPDGYTSFTDFLKRSGGIAYATAKSAVVGAASTFIGGKAGAKALEVTGKAALGTAANMSGFVVTATGLGAAVEGQVPNARDFLEAATIVALMHGVVKGAVKSPQAVDRIAQNMRDIYRKSGVTPQEQMKRSQEDPAYAQTVMGRNPDNGPLPVRDAPPEPEPYKAPEVADAGTPFPSPVAFPERTAIGRGHEGYADLLAAGRDSARPVRLKSGEVVNMGHLEDPNGERVVIAFDKNGELVGKLDYTTTLQDDGRAWNPNAYVTEAWRRKGVATAMYDAAESFGGKLGEASDQRQVRTDEGQAFRDARDKTKQPLSKDEQLQLVRQLERSGDDAISPAGAIGRYQIMPDTARQYGFDPTRLKDPEYNQKAAEKILADLSRRYKKPDGTVDQEAVLIGYNAGPGRANSFIRGGRDRSKLPLETQRYLEHADRLGGLRDDAPPVFEKPAEGKPVSKEELVQVAQDIISNPPELSISEKVENAKRRFVFDAISELSPAERIDKALGTPDTEFGIADNFRQTYGSAGRAWHRLYVGGLDRSGEAFSKNDAPPLMSMYDNVKNKADMKELHAVRTAARTMELQERGIKTPMKVEDAAEIMKTLGPKYKAELEIARKANDAKIDDYVAAGMMSKENADIMKQNNRNWYPMVPEKEALTTARKGSRFGPLQVVRRIKGHENQIIDPRVQEVKSFYSMAAVADKNRAMAALIKGLIPKGTNSNEPIGMTLKSSEKVGEVLDAQGNLKPEVFEGQAPITASDKTVSYFEDGMRHTYEVEDPLLAQMIRGMVPFKGDQVGGILRWFATVKRSGITDMPDFILRAMTKDAVGSAILSKWGGAPFVNTIRGVFHLSKADPIFQEFVANGGLGAALSDMDANWVKRDLHRMDKEAGFYKAIINTASHPIEAAQIIMQRMDAATRIGGYMRMKEAGLSPLKAGTEARKMTLDFSEKAGSQTLNILAGIVPFYRPSILGSKQMYDAFTQRPVETSIKAVTYIGLATALLYAINSEQDEKLQDDHKFEQVPRWQKDTSFVLPEVGGMRVRVPMPNTLGVLVGGMTNRVLDHFMKSDPIKFKEWRNNLLDSFLPPITPAAIQPIIEHKANANFFLGRPLIPTSLEGASGYEQFTPATSAVAKELSTLLGPPRINAVDVSPIVLDNYVRQWTGGLGVAVLRATNAVFDPGRPTEMADNPFVGSFFARTPGMSSQSISDFYDELSVVKGRHKDLALAIERGDIAGINFTSQNVKAFINLKEISDALTQQRAAINAISRDETMTVNEKRQFIDSIASGMVQVAKGGLAVLDSVDGK